MTTTTMQCVSAPYTDGGHLTAQEIIEAFILLADGMEHGTIEIGTIEGIIHISFEQEFEVINEGTFEAEMITKFKNVEAIYTTEDGDEKQAHFLTQLIEKL